MNTVYFFKKKCIIYLLSLFLGYIGTLAFSPYDIWPAAIIAMVGLLSILIHRKIKQSIIIGFTWGLGFFGYGVNWIYISIPKLGSIPFVMIILLVLVFSAYLSFYTVLFTIFITYFFPKTTWWRLVLGAPSIWQGTELLRGFFFTGFPWLQFGYSQINGPLKVIAPILGVYSITSILISMSGLLVFSIKKSSIRQVIFSIVIFLLPFPFYQLQWFTIQPDQSIKVAIVQGNIAPFVKWDPKMLSNTIDIYLEETRPYIGNVPIIIWPESAIPDIESNQKKFLTMIDHLMRKKNSNLITGILDSHGRKNGEKIFNSAIVLGERKNYIYPHINRYDKSHLVPFGEYIPFEYLLRHFTSLFNILPIRSIFRSGDYLQPSLSIKGYKFTVAICYEIVLGSQLRDNFRIDTHLLLTISNDSWFCDSICPWQHFQIARMRALELGHPLLCSSNNGITAVISPNGDVLASIPQFTRKVLSVKIIPTTGRTPYVIFGNYPIFFIILLFGTIALLLEHQRYGEDYFYEKNSIITNKKIFLI